MASIASLLNPVDDQLRNAQLPSPVPSFYARDFSPPPKKQKMTKDGAVFNKGKIRGELRFPPYEIQDEELAKHHQRFQVYPMGEIQLYPRHIPYNSEKKTFQDKTGRESFELFQYTFRLPKHDKEYVVMWDYNIGLVRMTPFFKCCNYSKTTPAKMLNMNPGSREICHSITGGALAAQGYWMPYEAAKAVAMTFCYNIRHALTPVFGVDFINSCIHPNDPSFGRMVIPKSVINYCTEQANTFRLIASNGRRFSRESSILHSPRTPQTPQTPRYPRWMPKSLRPKTVRVHGSESGYGTDSDCDDRDYVASGHRNQWTPANTPRSAAFPSPRSMLTSIPAKTKTISASSATDSENAMEISSSDSNTSGSATPTKRRLLDADDDYLDDDDDTTDVDSESEMEQGPEQTLHMPIKRPNEARDAKAAYMLMKLHMADATLKEDGSLGKRRRAST